MACVLRLCRPKHLEDRYYDPDDEPDFGVGGGGGGGGGLEGDHEGGLDPRAPRVQRASTVSLVPPWTTGRLVVEVLGAKGLAAVDENGFSDPFVTVRLATPGSGASLPTPRSRSRRSGPSPRRRARSRRTRSAWAWPRAGASRGGRLTPTCGARRCASACASP